MKDQREAAPVGSVRPLTMISIVAVPPTPMVWVTGLMLTIGEATA